MNNIYKFSNWNQLSGLKSIEYPSLIIKVTQFNSEELIGTKIDILNTDNELTYFSAFIRVQYSTVFNPLAVFEVDDIIKRINAYGFNIAIIEPTILPPNVIAQLRGLYELGYNYLTLEYVRTTKTDTKYLYQSDIDDDVNEYSDGTYKTPYVAYSNKYLVVTKGLNDYPNKNRLDLISPYSNTIYVISNAPNFNWEDFKWVEPTKVYSIEKLLDEDRMHTVDYINEAVVVIPPDETNSPNIYNDGD